MGLLDIASIRSIERGFSYYQSKCVINLKSYSETQFEAEVKGSGSNVYRCYIDMEHPRKSKCNCPHADGRRVICKHYAYLNMLIEHGEMAELFGLDEEEDLFEDEDEFY